MKCDVVVCFFRTHKLWPYVAWGLAQNKEYINTVIISADEEWTYPDRTAIEIVSKEAGLDCPHLFVGHERIGMEQARCFNTGVRYAKSEFILQLDDDIVVAPGALKTFFEHEPAHTSHLLLAGLTHDIPRGEFPISRLSDPEILRRDCRRLDVEGWIANPVMGADFWPLVRDSFLFYRKEDYQAISGHDESYHHNQEHGYGFIDWDFGIRWVRRFGIGSFEMTKAFGYHMGGMKPGHQFSPINQKKFTERQMDWYRFLGLEEKDIDTVMGTSYAR